MSEGPATPEPEPEKPRPWSEQQVDGLVRAVTGAVSGELMHQATQGRVAIEPATFNGGPGYIGIAVLIGPWGRSPGSTLLAPLLASTLINVWRGYAGFPVRGDLPQPAPRPGAPPAEGAPELDYDAVIEGPDPELADKLARHVHDAWIEQAEAAGQVVPAEYRVPWDELPKKHKAYPKVSAGALLWALQELGYELRREEPWKGE